ncbi:monocopper oxidase-like protein SKS1 [Nymphaea colorata]|nr:monocopper oxidase-like protein SKS1 [Nymphaea colorata]
MASLRQSAPALLLLLGFLTGSVLADDPLRTYDWTVSYSLLSPLDLEKMVIVINGQFPGPLLSVSTNDVASVTVRNNLTEPFLLTWNGIQMRRNSWQDGAQETNCAIPAGGSWTYHFQVKDQIGSFFYYPTLLLQKAAGGYGAIRVNNRGDVVNLPLGCPCDEFDVLIGDWYNTDYRELRLPLQLGLPLSYQPDGVLINGVGPYQTNFLFKPGAAYRLRISNVGLKASLNFRIQSHRMLLVETEGSYTVQRQYESLDVHVGQSYSVIVRADQPLGAYFMVASTRFLDDEVWGVATVRYSGFSGGPSSGHPPPGPDPLDYFFSMHQARTIRWNLSAEAARPNPQGSFQYGLIRETRFLLLENDRANLDGLPRYTVNGVSFLHPDTPLKLADYFQIDDVFSPAAIPDVPDGRSPSSGTSVIDVPYRGYVHIVFQNSEDVIQSWHIDGYNFFVVGMDVGAWNESKRDSYNMVDAVSRSTVQVYPQGWTAVMTELDNQGMWNIRSQMADRQFLGQELYLRVNGTRKGAPTASERDELPLPGNAILCGRAIGML